MDIVNININPVSGNSQSYTPPVTGKSEIPQETIKSEPLFGNNVGNSDSTQYENEIRKAALSFKNTYAVSDTEFTIFKDSSGQYITRYTSLRDGSVTYVPEPVLIRSLQGNTGNIGVAALVSINA
ncbi:MAG: hypothetical protein WCJ33_02040 [Pseudomonadota bacterium]